MIKVLLEESPCDFEKANKHGITPVAAAREAGHDDVVLLIERRKRKLAGIADWPSYKPPSREKLPSIPSVRRLSTEYDPGMMLRQARKSIDELDAAREANGWVCKVCGRRNAASDRGRCAASAKRRRLRRQLHGRRGAAPHRARSRPPRVAADAARVSEMRLGYKFACRFTGGCLSMRLSRERLNPFARRALWFGHLRSEPPPAAWPRIRPADVIVAPLHGLVDCQRWPQKSMWTTPVFLRRRLRAVLPQAARSRRRKNPGVQHPAAREIDVIETNNQVAVRQDIGQGLAVGVAGLREAFQVRVAALASPIHRGPAHREQFAEHGVRRVDAALGGCGPAAQVPLRFCRRWHEGCCQAADQGGASRSHRGDSVQACEQLALRPLSRAARGHSSRVRIQRYQQAGCTAQPTNE